MKYRSFAVGLLAAAGLLVATSSASAAVTATLNQACYTHVPTAGSDPLTATLTGGTPGANFIFSATVPGRGTGSAGFAQGTFDAAGNATASITNVRPQNGTIGPTRGQVVNLSVQDFGVPGSPEQPVGTATVTNLALNVSSRPRSPRRARTVSVSGTPFANQHLYGFVVKGTSRTVLRRIDLGTANGCGFTTAKKVVAPRTFRPGTYRLYINAGRSLDKARALGTRFRITRTIL
jgi:hypothetical protein